MPAIGANLKLGNPKFTMALLRKKLTMRFGGLTRIQSNATRSGAADLGTTAPRLANLFVKNGIPATSVVGSNAADAPSGVNDLCFDNTNGDLYQCTAYTSAATFTWTKIMDF